MKQIREKTKSQSNNFRKNQRNEKKYWKIDNIDKNNKIENVYLK